MRFTLGIHGLSALPFDDLFEFEISGRIQEVIPLR